MQSLDWAICGLTVVKPIHIKMLQWDYWALLFTSRKVMTDEKDPGNID